MCTSTNVRHDLDMFSVIDLTNDTRYFIETKNTWARDDPAILVLIAACLSGVYRLVFWYPCPVVNIKIYSGRYRVGCRLLIQPNRNAESRGLHDIEGLPTVGCDCGHDYLVCSPSSTAILCAMTDTHVRFTANRLLLSPLSHSTPADSQVEWAYAFDVHTNAFFPLFLTLYLAQLFLLPIILKDYWVCLWIGNTLYLAA